LASFYWKQQVDQGCPLCGTSVSERGFVDAIADTLVRNTEGEITGVVDLFVCASCIEQMAQLVGSASKQETLDMAERIINTEEELEKTKDEVQAWSQRYDQLINNLSTDISTYIKEKDATSNSHPKRRAPNKRSS